MNEKSNLIGFLFSYDWLPIINLLSAEEFKALFLALLLRQKDGVPIPHFESDLANAIASMIEPTIKRRLNGQKGGLKTQKNARKSSASRGSLKGASEDSIKHTSEAI